MVPPQRSFERLRRLSSTLRLSLPDVKSAALRRTRRPAQPRLSAQENRGRRGDEHRPESRRRRDSRRRCAPRHTPDPRAARASFAGVKNIGANDRDGASAALDQRGASRPYVTSQFSAMPWTRTFAGFVLLDVRRSMIEDCGGKPNGKLPSLFRPSNAVGAIAFCGKRPEKEHEIAWKAKNAGLWAGVPDDRLSSATAGI